MKIKEKIKPRLLTLHVWQIVLISIIGAVFITNLITALISLWIWHEIQLNLIVLGTINAFLVPLIILPAILRSLRKLVILEEQDQINKQTILQLEAHRQVEESAQRRAGELSLLYHLGISLTSGKDLRETLLTLQREILKLIQADVLFVAIYNEITEIIEYPIFFEEGKPGNAPSRNLRKEPGLTGSVIYNKKTLYLMDFKIAEVLKKYKPVDDNDLRLHTFLGIPLRVNDKVIGVLSVQSIKIDAYSQDQIQLMENVAVQAALAIDKTRLLDQYQNELKERKRVEDGLQEREAILEAVTFAAEQLLKTADWRTNINPMLERLAKTINASHAYLFEHQIGMDGIEYSSLKYEWTADGYANDFDNPYYQVPNPLKLDEGSTDYSLRQGHIFMGNASNFHPAEKERLIKLGVKAMLEMPLFVGEKWWGTFGFDDFENEREWSNSEVDALKIAAGILSAAIQRQKADAAVQESEQIYRQAIEAAGAVPYYREYNIDRYQFMGQGFQKLTGYPPEEMKESFWNSIVQEYKLIGDLAAFDLYEAGRRVRNGEFNYWKCDYRIMTRDGQLKWISDSSIELFDANGKSYASVGIMQDISERKRTEQALIFSEEKFSKAFDTTPVMMSIEDAGGSFIEVNKAFIDNIGFDRKDVIGRRASDLNMYRTLEDRQKVQKLLQEQGDFKDIELSYRQKSGKLGVVLMSIEKFHVNDETYTLTSALDITDRKHSEAEREKLIEELEAKNEELERFTYTVSHDLKSPLVTINGFLGYLEQDAASGNMERLKSDTQRIQDAVNKMQRLLNELLELSRIGRIMNTPETSSIEELVKDALDIVHGQFEAQKVSVQIQPNLPAVYGDKPRLIEAIQNMLDNAAKYMGAQPSPHIEIGYSGDENGKSIFYIKDNGIGIAPEYHERVFGLFNKLDAKSEGTGVGLALVKRILEIHGGRVWVKSEAGQGSTFFFTLAKPTQ